MLNTKALRGSVGHGVAEKVMSSRILQSQVNRQETCALVDSHSQQGEKVAKKRANAQELNPLSECNTRAAELIPKDRVLVNRA